MQKKKDSQNMMYGVIKLNDNSFFFKEKKCRRVCIATYIFITGICIAILGEFEPGRVFIKDKINR